MLTKKDTETVQTMIDKSLKANNDVLMARIIDAIGNYPTKTEVNDMLSDYVKKDAFEEVKADIHVLKDDMSQLRIDMQMLRAFVESKLGGN